MIPMTARMVTLDDGLLGLDSFPNELNRLFAIPTGRAENFPAVNVWSDQEKTVVTADLPGVEPGAVQVTVQGDELSIAGERKAAVPGKDEVYHRQERSSGPFSRVIGLPYAVAADKVSAKYNQGVLEVTLPRHEATKPHRIVVSGE